MHFSLGPPTPSNIPKQNKIISSVGILIPRPNPIPKETHKGYWQCHFITRACLIMYVSIWEWPKEQTIGFLVGARSMWMCLLFLPCQVRVVRFYLSCLLLSSPLLSSPVLSSPLLSSPLLSSPLLSSPLLSSPLLLLLLLLLNRDPRSVCPAGPQPRPATVSVPCRTSTTTIPAQCSLPDLNHDHPRPVFPAGPQPRVSPPSVPCRTSTASIHAKCSLPDLM